MAEKPQAPRGTYDVLPEQDAARAAVERAARDILGGSGYRRIETPIFEHTELFARGVGASTDIVQKEMYTFTDAGDRSLTLRPEGTAPVMRAYAEHGMHKLPQPVKLWYFGPFFRQEKPQAGRFRQFWQVGAEAIGSDDPAVDAETILLLQTLIYELGIESVRLRLGSLGTPETRAEYRDKLIAHLRAHESELSEDVRARIDLNPLRAFDADHPGTRKVMESAPLLLDHLTRRGRRALRRGARAPGRRRRRVRDRPDARARPRLLHADAVRVHLRRARRAVGRRWRRALRRAGRGARASTATPGIGWAAGVERLLLAGDHKPHPEAVCDLYVAGHDASPRSPWPPRRAAPGSTCSSSSRGARARASSSRPTDPARATSPSSAKTKGPS